MAVEPFPLDRIWRTSELLTPPGLRRSSKSATRALDVLEYFAVVKRPLRAKDIADTFALHPSSTDQLLKTLVNSGYLLIEPMAKLYYPSPRLARFASWLATSYFGGDHLSRMIEGLARDTGEIVILSAPIGGWLQFVEVIAPPDALDTAPKASRLPVLASAIGEAFLAAHTDQEVMRWISRTPEARDLDAAMIDKLLGSLRAARERGYTCGVSDHADLFSIALALPKPATGVQLVLSLAGPTDRMERRRRELLGIARAAITANLSG